MDKEISMERVYYGRGPGALRGPDALIAELQSKGVHDITRAEVEKWLKSQPAYTLYRPARRNYTHNPITTNVPGEVFQIDIMDMSRFLEHNNYYRYILLGYDSYSKFVTSHPLKTREPLEVLSALQEFIHDLPFSIAAIYWDKVR